MTEIERSQEEDDDNTASEPDKLTPLNEDSPKDRGLFIVNTYDDFIRNLPYVEIKGGRASSAKS